MKYYILILLSLLISSSISAQSDWILSNNGIPDNFNIYDFMVTQPNEIYAVGASVNFYPTPKLYKSTNNGENWTELSVEGLESHNYVYAAICLAGSKMFISASSFNTAYAIYSSLDGTSWTLSNTGIPEKFITRDFIVISPSEIYAIGWLFYGISIIPGIYKTTNSGVNWEEVPVSGIDTHNLFYHPSCIAGSKMFIDATSTDSTYSIYSSTDGTTWSPSNTGIPENFDTYDFCVISPTEIFAIGGLFTDTLVSAGIYKSVNAGESWEWFPVNGMSSHNYLYSAACISGSKMFINAQSTEGTYAIYSSTIPDYNGIEQISSNKFSIFPNPANDYINISAEEKFNEIRIHDLHGRLLKSTTDNILFIGDLPHSLYVVNVVKDGKIVKKQTIIVE